MIKKICVFSSSSPYLEDIYYDEAEKLGYLLSSSDYQLVFGAGETGLMGSCARGIHRGKGQVIGVIPEKLNQEHIVYQECNELFVTECLRSRKKTMDDLSDAFIALPGGFGTLEELLEAITLKQLFYHDKPIVIINTNGFFDCLLAMFEKIRRENFASLEGKELYYIAKDSEDAINYLSDSLS